MDRVGDVVSDRIDPDRIDKDEIRKKIKTGAFVLIENKKETTLPTWQNLRLIPDNSIPQNVLNSLCELRHDHYR